MWNDVSLDKIVLYGIVQKIKHFENVITWLFDFLEQKLASFWNIFVSRWILHNKWRNIKMIKYLKDIIKPI